MQPIGPGQSEQPQAALPKDLKIQMPNEEEMFRRLKSVFDESTTNAGFYPLVVKLLAGRTVSSGAVVMALVTAARDFSGKMAAPIVFQTTQRFFKEYLTELIDDKQALEKTLRDYKASIGQ